LNKLIVTNYHPDAIPSKGKIHMLITCIWKLRIRA